MKKPKYINEFFSIAKKILEENNPDKIKKLSQIVKEARKEASKVLEEYKKHVKFK